SNWASSHPSGSGQVTLAAVARFRYSCTVLTDREQLRAICLWSSFSSYRSLRTSLVLRMDVLLAGNDSSHWEGSRTGGDVQRRSPVENVPGQAEQRSGAARIVFAFSPDSCSPSARNPVRDQRGILFGFTPESRSPCPGFRTAPREHAGEPLDVLCCLLIRRHLPTTEKHLNK